jgi:hypothetical protein
MQTIILAKSEIIIKYCEKSNYFLYDPCKNNIKKNKKTNPKEEKLAFGRYYMPIF